MCIILNYGFLLFSTGSVDIPVGTIGAIAFVLGSGGLAAVFKDALGLVRLRKENENLKKSNDKYEKQANKQSLEFESLLNEFNKVKQDLEILIERILTIKKLEIDNFDIDILLNSTNEKDEKK